MHRKSFVVGFTVFIGTAALAGPLTPPAGPIAPTPGPEPRIAINATNTPGDADSLFRITQPGSYYLAGNISNVNAEHGIEIANSGVTLDLNGFSVTGFGGLTGVIVTNSAVERIVIRNGSIANFVQRGIDANVRMVNVDRISVEACGVLGIRAGRQARITDCTVVDCHTNADGIQVSSESIVDRCIAENNSGIGISVGVACTVFNSTARGNTNSGFFLNAGCTITHCSAYDNDGNGISASSASMVADCTVSSNTLNGIECGSECVIRGNTCSSNGLGGDGAGIRAASDDNRIEGNNCSSADRGIDVDGTRNIIIKNTCRGNTTNWTIAALNAYGPIVATPPGAAVNGNTAAAALGSTDPNANFSY